ncbi:MAG TPA: hypothetical protein PL155_07770 [Candidatus Omnitrophota bacterium]|nr:hypothetical protein [Candidatus Omnitrophota bacterium]HPD85268.1 hypothetical protein [Candidatus Omnitrophota bacterium]HRZ04231.1 hypothetical protein [Candidatus Omnitrophota bacterium]
MNNKPKQKIRFGDVNLCVWENTIKIKDNAVPVLTYTFSKSYRSRGKFKYMRNFQKQDLPNITKAIEIISGSR